MARSVAPSTMLVQGRNAVSILMDWLRVGSLESLNQPLHSMDLDTEVPES